MKVERKLLHHGQEWESNNLMLWEIDSPDASDTPKEHRRAKARGKEAIPEQRSYTMAYAGFYTRRPVLDIDLTARHNGGAEYTRKRCLSLSCITSWGSRCLSRLLSSFIPLLPPKYILNIQKTVAFPKIMPTGSSVSSSSLSQTCWALIRLSRFDRYNSLLALFPSSE